MKQVILNIPPDGPRGPGLGETLLNLLLLFMVCGLVSGAFGWLFG